MKKIQLFMILFATISTSALAQSRSTASRAGDLQIGGGYSIAKADYLTNRIKGFDFYADFDFKPHWGVELNFHQLNDNTGTQVYERSYEAGGRYTRRYFGFVNPYVKGLYGRGVYNYSQSQANLAYNMLVGGGGIDFNVHKRVNVRVDYEYQHWMSFPYSGLNPQVVTVGAAYHFGAGKAH